MSDISETRFNEPKVVRTWKELAKAESETHILEIGDGNGWIHPKNDLEFTGWEGHHYLSTHTFYEETYGWSNKVLQECGFNVVIEPWGD